VAADVVTDHGQVLVALLVLDLIDRDRGQPVEQIDPVERLGRETDAHVVDGLPRHVVASGGSVLVAHDRVVHDEVLERPGEA